MRTLVLLGLLVNQGFLQDCSAQSKSSIDGETLVEMGIVDLTHPFDQRTIYWPTESGFHLRVREAGFNDKGYYYASNAFSAAEHGGTHIDAPIHFFERGQTVDQLPLSRLIGSAAVIDVTKACDRNPDYQIGVADLRSWEEKHQELLLDKIILLRTGFARRWPDPGSYLGTEEKGAEGVANLHFPGLAPQAARWLVEHRSIKAIGIDTASIDYGQSKRFESHVTLFEHGIPAFENLANLGALPLKGAYVTALPMKIAGGSGAPLRIVARLPTP
jgi:kynurenine formamidase